MAWYDMTYLENKKFLNGFWTLANLLVGIGRVVFRAGWWMIRGWKKRIIPVLDEKIQSPNQRNQRNQAGGFQRPMVGERVSNKDDGRRATQEECNAPKNKEE